MENNFTLGEKVFVNLNGSFLCGIVLAVEQDGECIVTLVKGKDTTVYKFFYTMVFKLDYLPEIIDIINGAYDEQLEVLFKKLDSIDKENSAEQEYCDTKEEIIELAKKIVEFSNDFELNLSKIVNLSNKLARIKQWDTTQLIYDEGKIARKREEMLNNVSMDNFEDLSKW